MIKANELRVGNLVLFDEKIDKIHSIGTNMANGEKHSHWYYQRIKPIPITAEILEKCGFYIFSDGTASKECEDFNLVYENCECKLIYHDGYTDTVSSSKPFKYLHQLQNLVFALTGEEIEVKL